MLQIIKATSVLWNTIWAVYQKVMVISLSHSSLHSHGVLFRKTFRFRVAILNTKPPKNIKTQVEKLKIFIMYHIIIAMFCWYIRVLFQKAFLQGLRTILITLEINAT